MWTDNNIEKTLQELGTKLVFGMPTWNSAPASLTSWPHKYNENTDTGSAFFFYNSYRLEEKKGGRKKKQSGQNQSQEISPNS